ncbi:hypothetical protein RMCBS344292_11402 [Rhizopus microsporus]|nr:hypothetical protein RMCBS344292_11402 [Rhizopus microsporus]
MSKNEQLNECLSQAYKLVGQKLEPKEEKGSIKDILTSRLQDLELESNKDEPKSSFVKHCLRLLISIQESLLNLCSHSKDESDKDFLGVRDLRLIHTLLEIVVSWGFYPCLLPGVGLPLSKRVKSEIFANDEDEEQTKQVSTKALHDLYDLVTPLVDLIAQSEKVPESKGYTTVASILMTRHLTDLYAAILELAYVPATEIRASVSDTDTLENELPMTPGHLLSSAKKEVGLPREKRDKCARMFMWLFDRSDVQRAMESLMSLISTSSLHPVPSWLRTICGRFLSRILLKPNGVAIVLEFTIGQVEQLQLAQLESISKLILSVPQQMTSIESYYSVITPQLLSLLQNETVSATTSQAVTFIIGRIITKHPKLGKTYLVDKIVDPLVSGWNQQEYDESNEDLMDRVILDEEPSPLMIQTCLSSSISCLYHLYEFTVQSKSGLRETVLDLLLTYFRITTTADGVRELKRILLNKVDISGERVAYFAPGPSGGATLRLRRKPKALAKNDLPLNADVLVQFLEKLGDLDLSGDVFVFLLNEYSSLQARKTDPTM